VIFLFTTAFRLALGPTQCSIQWVLEYLSLWQAKWLGYEAEPSFSSSDEATNGWSYTSTPPYDGVVLN